MSALKHEGGPDPDLPSGLVDLLAAEGLTAWDTAYAVKSFFEHVRVWIGW